MGGFFGLQALQEPSVGSFSDPYLSLQLATSPQADYILSTDGTDSSWIVNAGAGSGDPFAWDIETGAVSTSTELWFGAGFISQASSTFTGATTTFTQRVNIGTTSPYTASSLTIDIANATDHGLIIQGTTNQDAHLFMLRDVLGTRLFNVSNNGEIEGFHTATSNNERGMTLTVDAAGFGNVNGIFINYTTGDIASGADEAAILVLLNRFASTNADSDAMAFECLATSGAAEAECLHVGVGVNPIHQFSGILGDMGFASSTADGDLFIHSATSTDQDATMFASDNDVVVIADSVQFSEMEFILDTPASGAGIKPTFGFSTACGSFTEFFPSDGTSGMKNSGEIAWELDDISAWATGCNNAYEIEIIRTQNGLATPPIENIIQIAATTEFKWDLDGDILVRNATTTNATTTNLYVSNELILDTATNVGLTFSSAHGAGFLLTEPDAIFNAIDSILFFADTDLDGNGNYFPSLELLTGGTKGINLTLNDEAGNSNFKIIDSGSGQVFIINSDGEVTTGIWQGTDIGVLYGGTGVSILSDILGTTNQIAVASGANTVIGGNVTLSFPSQLALINASTTNLSSLCLEGCAFGSTATSSFNSAGVLTLITALAVGSGGTGATSLTDGYVLLGSGSGAITALDITAKGSILVGDGTTDPIALGVGTNDFVLTAASGETSGLIWAAAAGGGGTGSNWTYNSDAQLDFLTPSTTVGVILNASTTINADLTITGIATTTNIIPSVDATSDLGSTPSFYYANAYIDRIRLRTTGIGSVGTAQINAAIIIDTSERNNVGISFLQPSNSNASGIFWSDSGDDDVGKLTYTHSNNQFEINTAGNTRLVIDTATFRPGVDSGFDIGRSSTWFDEIYGDELVVNSSNGVSATAANQVRLSGLDLSAGDAGLNIRTEDDTDHLFASLVGLGTTSPATMLDVFTTGTTTITIDSNSLTQGACIKIKDFDGDGYTYLTVNNGTQTFSTISCE